MRTKISKRIVDQARPTSATYLIRDTEVKGFALVVTPNGARSYALDYRVGTGRGALKRRYTIGKHGSPWTPEMARNEAIRLLGDVRRGDDPADKRTTERQALSVNQLTDLYLAEGATHKKASTLKSDRGRFEHHIRPLLGRKRIDQVSRGDIERLMIDVTSGKTAAEEPKGEDRKPGSIPSGGAGAAAQCVTLMGTLLAFAIERGLRKDNPAHGVKKRAVRKLERFLSEEEIGLLAAALEAERKAGANQYAIAAIKLLLVTGCRRGEILGLQWPHVDFEHRCLRLPDSKTGAKIVYLNAPALAILEALPRIEDNPHVIAGLVDGANLVGIDKIWFRVRARAELGGLRLHDLRHSFASVGAAGGLSLPIIGALLGHKHAATTARYSHLSADPLRAANDAVGRKIAAAMANEVKRKSTGTVVTLSTRTA